MRARYDPLERVGPILDRSVLTEGCCCLCCRCGARRGLFCALGAFMAEAVWHIVISFIRPRWEWTSEMITIFGFFLQDTIRVVLLCLSILAWRALKRGEQGVAELRIFLRGLIVLFLFETLEISLKATEVHGICDAPEVWERRLRRNSTMSEGMCEVVSNLYDYAWGVCVLILLAAVIRMVHAHLTALGGATWQQRQQERQQTTSQQPPARGPQDVEVAVVKD